MAANAGWSDPAWGQIYAPTPTAAAPPEVPQPAVSAAMAETNYLDMIADAAAADQEFDLADLPDFRTRFYAPRGLGAGG